MIDESKRSLRARKNPKYLNSDEQDPDKVSFSQLKSHHDYSSALNQKAQDAKILVKLINKINKSYRAYLNELPPNAIQPQKTELIQKEKKAENPPEPNRRTTLSKENKKELQPKPKPISNFKSQYAPKQLETPKNTEAYINQLKQMGSLPTMPGIGKGLFTDQLKKLQTLYPDMKNISYQTLTQNTNPHLFSGSLPSTQKTKKQTQPKSAFAQQKLFKRSAYHVAIAYHIYLKNLKEKGGPIGNEIDPTYHAKRLKQGRPLD